MIELSGNDRGLFASDIHLDDQDPDTARLFFEMLALQAPQATHLFLLGDLFEAWVGDDDNSQVGLRLEQTLAQLAGGGLQIFLMRGNRDFLIDVPLSSDGAGLGEHDGRPGPPAAFSQRAGASLLSDPCSVNLFGIPTLLTHGDLLCIDDTDYQAFRRQSRSQPWQQTFLAQALERRQASARQMREQSTLEKSAKMDALMDVNAQAVHQAMRQAGVRQMIHGHTHRPARHQDPAGSGTLRWVLPDWDAQTMRGGMLLAIAGEMRQIGNWD
ncbi:MAG: UDP-2,3-diacylglucosamine diphosphatase [Quisquiliibacterium sp.]